MSKRTYLASDAKRSDQISASLSRADMRLVRARIESLGLSGPSEFIRTLLHQAIGAGLAIVTDFDVKPVGRKTP